MTARLKSRPVATRPPPQPAIDVDKALCAALGDPKSWTKWISVLRGAYALPMGYRDRIAFAEVAAGGRAPPEERVRELWVTAGRRSGKSRIAAALATYAAAFIPHSLARGETGTILVLAASQDQAKTVYNYCRGFIEASPVLRGEIEGLTATSIRLKNGAVIMVHPNSHRTVRGKTLLLCVFDEVSQWRDIESALPDIETYRAVLPSLATTSGMLVGISSPYRRTGLLFAKYRHHFGIDDPRTLVVQASSRVLNPTLDQEVIDAAMLADPEAAISEWEGEFRNDLSNFLDEEAIEACTDFDRPMEIAPRSGVSYQAFVDPSGGRHDHFCLCILHREGSSDYYFVADVVRGMAPPFDPESVVDEYTALLKAYRIAAVTGDAYSAGWCETAFQKRGIRCIRSELPKSQLYIEALPHFACHAINMPNDPKLIRELRLLERRTSRMGKDQVDHGKNGSDDYANVLVGALRQLANSSYDPFIDAGPSLTALTPTVGPLGTWRVCSST